MTEPAPRCPTGSALVELALDELSGRDRAATLAHVLECSVCSAQVRDVIDTAELLLLAAVESEPPPGLESTVVRRLRAAATTPRPWPARMLAMATAVTIVVTLIGASVLLPRGSTEIAEAAMATPTGHDVGQAWRYAGDPSWVFVSVPDWQVWDQPGAAPHEYRLLARLDDGTRLDLGAVTFAVGTGTWGATTTVDASRIRTIAVVDNTGRTWCEGTF